MAYYSTSKFSEEDIKKYPFPSSKIPPKKKKDKEIGKTFAWAIFTRFRYEDSINNRISKIRENRLFSNGEQPEDRYKPMLDASIDNSGDESWITIDWSISSPAQKFVNLLIGGMVNQDYKIQCNAIDPTSKTRRSKDRDKFYNNLLLDQELRRMEEETGIPLVSKKGFHPESEEELELYMDIDYKQAIEIGTEEIIEHIFQHNDWSETIAKRIIRDLVENAEGRLRLYYDNNNKIRLRYVDIEKAIRTPSSQPDLSDVDYNGEIRYMTLREIRRMSDDMSEEEFFKLARNAVKKQGTHKWHWGDTWRDDNMYEGNTYSFEDLRVEVMDFEVLTTDVHKWRSKKGKKGQTFFDKKDSSYKGKSDQKKTVHTKEIETSYDGIWVVGTDHMVRWGESRNITRDIKKTKEGNQVPSPEVKSKFVAFRLPGKSMVEIMKPQLDDIQLATLKRRHFIAEAVPPGLHIDASKLTELDFGISESKEFTPMSLIQLFKQKGIMLYNGKDDFGNDVNRKPIENSINGIGDALVPLMNDIQYSMNQIRENTGINEARDTTEMDKKALVGIQKMQLLASNNATRELYDAYAIGIFQRAGEIASRMIHDKIVYMNGVDEYEGVIGELGVKSLEFQKDMSLAELGIKVEALPDSEDLQRFEQNIAISLERDQITLDDAEVARSFKNIKKGMHFLKYRRKVRKQEQMMEFQEKERITAEREQAAAMASAEAEKVKHQSEAEKNILTKQKEYELKLEYLQAETQEKIKIEDRKGYWEERKIDAAVKAKLETEKGMMLLQGGEDVPDSVDEEDEGGTRSMTGVSGTRQAPMPKVGSDPVRSATRTD